MSLDEIGSDVGISRERARQLVERALGEMRSEAKKLIGQHVDRFASFESWVTAAGCA